MSGSCRLVIAFCGLVACSASVWAEPARAGEYSIVVENDLFSGRGHSDRWYTSGIHASWVVDGQRTEDLLPRLGRWLRERLDDPRDSDDQYATLAGLSHSIYTPQDIKRADVQRFDRPWAAWLSMGLGLARRRGDTHEMLNLRAGPIGPAALGQELQSWIHKHISNSPRPAGWEHQLRGRLGVQIGYVREQRLWAGSHMALNGNLGGVLGNTRTLATAGLGLHLSPGGLADRRLQVGTMDEGDFMQPDLRSHSVGEGFMGRLKGTVLFVQLQGNAVAHNVFVTGSTFDERPDLRLRRQVYTFSWGITVPLDQQGHYQLGYVYKRRSPEFEARGLDRRDAFQSWGALVLSGDWR